MPHLRAGGGQRVGLPIATSLAQRNHRVVLAICEPHGELSAEEIELVGLDPSPGWIARMAAPRADPSGPSALLRPVLLAPQTHILAQALACGCPGE